MTIDEKAFLTATSWHIAGAGVDPVLDLYNLYLVPVVRAQIHRDAVRHALQAAERALESAVAYGARQDCLRCAVADLRGALRNLEPETLPPAKKRRAKQAAKKPSAKKAKPRR